MDVDFLHVPASESNDNVDPQVTNQAPTSAINDPEDNRLTEDNRLAETGPDNQNQNPQSLLQPPRAPRKTRLPIPKEPTRRSTRARNLSKAMLESKAYQEDKEKAREAGESWAKDWEPVLPEFDEDEEGQAQAALIAQNEPLALEPDNKWTPMSHAKAITRVDLWGPALDKEIGRLDERKAFTPVPREDWRYIRKNILDF
ncbi:hypothetical protein F5878DRAFT_667902 [Lentinula raphanica]|uniref:Uncharacterized protein n=1 Tax=Lentinula raphanica TaxID=153919 RepID=A0AA38U2D4_9AGAR|nr:hypothetical protein F5878DRAFT_667902 [Lentinula raphanica]